MDSGRMPACDSLPLVGEPITSVPNNVLIGRDANNYYPGMQLEGKGNRCGHDRNNLKQFIPPQNYKRRPHSIEEALRRLKEVEDKPNRYGDVTSLFFHSKDKGGRKKRSERLEASKRLVLITLLYGLNLQKMVFGYYNNRNEFHYFDYAKIQKLTGLSEIRIKRAMKDLQDQEIVKVNPIKQPNNDGSYRTIRVEIEFTDKIFQMLELMPEFLKDRETSSIKFHEKQASLDKKQKKREFYRKNSFTPPKSSKNRNLKPTLSSGLQTLVKGVVRGIPPSKPGHGVEVRDKINSLVRQGLSIKDAMEIVKQQYPPPN
jgi:hypothetical protein